MRLPVCTTCGKRYPETGTPYLCECGGVFDLDVFPTFEPSKIDPSRTGMWKYGAMFNLPEGAPQISLGEGNTPLLELPHLGRKVFAKLEYQNPTGSYKDRGSAVLMSFMASRGVTRVVEDSSGNAGASLAAYAARAGVSAKVFIPENASGPKRKQIEFYGAELACISGPRMEAARAVKLEADAGIPYASHAFMPFGLTGIASIVYEIAAELGWQAPGSILSPLGHGGLLYGIMRGFEALRQAGIIEAEPYYMGVQAAGCAPVFNAYENRVFTLREPVESDTIAEGVRVSHPVRGEAILRKLSLSKGNISQIKEEDLLTAYGQLAEMGLFVEPTSALVWAALNTIATRLPEPIILILTGAGTKSKFLF
ncbi:MAG: pyridoxal-phosphate dependent enzyme [Anaerolineaceae bacterium]|nr:pyridoxal-phosphate dependent enzyme [Anaerolineaceae bacterium]